MTSWITVRVPVELDVIVETEEVDPQVIVDLARQTIKVQTASPLISDDPLAWEVVSDMQGKPEVTPLDDQND